MNWDIKISIEKRSSDYGRENVVTFKFEDAGKVWSKSVDSKHMQDEKQREAILGEMARAATNELVIPKIVHGMLHALVSSALKGDNPLE